MDNSIGFTRDFQGTIQTDMYPHRIRLRGPWDWETISARGSVTMPAALPMPGPIRLRRRFGWPGRLDTHERVWLTFADLPGVATVTLNGQPVDMPEAAGEFDVTALLRARNELLLEFDAAVAGPMGEVGLEVRCTAWLRDVQHISAPAGYRVVGEVAGTADQPLDLYLLVERATVAYASMKAGDRFELKAPAPEAAAALRLELVQGGVVWYALDLATQR